MSDVALVVQSTHELEYTVLWVRVDNPDPLPVADLHQVPLANLGQLRARLADEDTEFLWQPCVAESQKHKCEPPTKPRATVRPHQGEFPATP